MVFDQTYKKIADFVDLEWFLGRSGKDSSPDHGNKVLLPLSGKAFSNLSDEELLDLWLQEQRAAYLASGRILPGSRVLSGLNILFLFVALVAAGFGFAVSLGILHYDGKLPVNLLYAFGVLVFLPFVTVLVTLFAMLFYRKKMPSSHALFLRGFRKMLFFMLDGLDAALPGEKRQDVLLLRRGMDDFSKKYAPMVRAFLFFVFQFGGFFLVAGMLGVFLIKVTGSDLAFAWQSTLDISSENLARFLGILGSPWKPFFPDAVPGLEQIEGSRIFLKDGISGLFGSHLAAWWAFMAMALVVYGLFPRFLLLVFAAWRFRKSVRMSTPDDSRTRALCFFLKRSDLHGEKEGSFWENEVVPEKDAVFRKGKGGRSGSGPWELWISEEIPDTAKTVLISAVGDWMGSGPEEISVVDLAKPPDVSDSMALILALEVFMPPVFEDLQALQAITKKIKKAFWVWPVGRLDAKPSCTPAPDDLLIWEKKLENLPEPRPLLAKVSPGQSEYEK